VTRGHSAWPVSGRRTGREAPKDAGSGLGVVAVVIARDGRG
jgi:hypothetical protein